MAKKITPKSIHVPALRCKMGDRGYFVASMRFDEVAELVKDISEVHKSKRLSEWIQRQLDEVHAAEIARYLIDTEERFINAMVIGVYGGDPQRSDMTVRDPRNELSDDEEERVNRTVGVLTLSGREKLFPIDGQHRVAGIKSSLKENPSLVGEEVAVILVGHARTELGLTRTRKLFVTLNQRAKKVSPRDIVALDEDNGLAVVTRRLIDDYSLFSKEGFVSFSGNVNLIPTDHKAITSVLGLFQVVKGLYPRDGKKWPKLKQIQTIRPDEPVIDAIFDYYVKYWETLISAVPEYKTTLKDEKKTCDFYRGSKQNHLLFRPLGQLAFSRAVEFMIAKGKSMEEAIKLLHSTNSMQLTDRIWHHILWNPVGQLMMTNWSAAQTLLLVTAGETGVSAVAKKRLKKLQAGPPE